MDEFEVTEIPTVKRADNWCEAAHTRTGTLGDKLEEVRARTRAELEEGAGARSRRSTN